MRKPLECEASGRQAPRFLYVLTKKITDVRTILKQIILYMNKFKKFINRKGKRRHNRHPRPFISNRTKEIEVITESTNETVSSEIPTVAIIYKSEFDFISRCILDYKNIETGGQLFGFWTAENIPVVLYAIGPGPNANHQPAFFNQDIPYLKRIGHPLIERFGLQHIGEWHSHHQLGLAQPSSHDAYTVSSTIREKHLRHFLLCIGNCTNDFSTLNAFNFVERDNDVYAKAHWCIKDIESPFRSMIDKELAPFLLVPKTETASHGYIDTIESSESSIELAPEYKKTYWFSEKENRVILKRIIDHLEMLPLKGKCTIQLDDNSYVTMTMSCGSFVDQIFFPSDFPQVSPNITRIYADNTIEKISYPWNPGGDIYVDFVNYYHRTLERTGKISTDILLC